MKTLGEMKIVIQCRKHGKVFPLLMDYSIPEGFVKYLCKQCLTEGKETSIILRDAKDTKKNIESYPPFDGKSPTIWKSTKGPLEWIKYDFGDLPKYTVKLKGVRLFDPRIGKLRKPGNNNPALIYRNLLLRNGYTITKEDDQVIKKMANYCDEKVLFHNLVSHPKISNIKAIKVKKVI